ncbi:hypothetical protein N8I77_003062 [Diaporthe amygdali]|uniref:Uncharacterized protein n=1 Tax=Phomopsis amygdali TaxID=1214568 RepID=A0AAD9W7A5_PHOAM|nr:uncharacterized protein J7T55_009925 [Diaporthe amygdali]KAJ0116774.1 hypothetical protein J7T55_009925 [Diaporthe amygdali]KAK2609566.1 hypothetical protein N8I77_003062 [Diaporthe amygdali]
MSSSWGLIIFAALVGLTSAAPSLLPRQAATTQLTFTGAGAAFSVTAPVDGSNVTLNNTLAVDFIAQAGTASCAFEGVDGVKLTVIGANSGATIAPPQTIVRASCQ